MELTLKRLLEHAEFKKYRGKGYDPTEVDDFLDRAAAMAGKVEVQLTQALEKAKAPGGAAPEVPEQDIEAEVQRRLAAHIAALPEPAPAGPTEDETAEEVRRTLIMAQRTADAAVKEAQEDAAKILGSATERSEAMLADAEARVATLDADVERRFTAARAELEAETSRERREARQRLAAEIAELEGLRESLRSDVNVLERHVEEQRSQLGSTLAELHQILDDPSGFRMAPAPALIDPELPDFSDLDTPAPEPEAEVAPEPAPAVQAPAAEVAPQPEPEPEPDPAMPAGDDEFSLPEPTERAAPIALEFDEVDHPAPGTDDPQESGPPTAPVSIVELDMDDSIAAGAPKDGDDAFLAELRKAMADDEPLGPRDQGEQPVSDSLFEDDDRRGWRFGRRH